MKKHIILTGIFVVTLLTTMAKAQTVINEKHWYTVSLSDGKVSISAHSIVTYIAMAVETQRGDEKMTIGNIAFRTSLMPGGGAYTFTGETFTGEKQLELTIEGARKATAISVTYYN